ncbi:FAD/NAD(P)-binding protein [Streptomyces sp. KN37]|uniref:FAD/NAD(P)-binding protein n=1 Tax=Streptomyces sp. KN37 TaxID=3090667 RepID=UPI002A75271E|nr:FAD/NAD(P)-binding protein [Streptomyces sp. KN37]WPO74064.1 FAD/NAD(P)-binding protein [Streptomyces sp. KN37]
MSASLPAPRPPAPDATALALVGAGPRGTSVLERLCASAAELLAPGTRLTVHVIDPEPPGPGRVWRTAQPAELLMNTVASQVTLFTDESVDCSGPIRPGPSLYEWAAAGRVPGLGPDDYPTRACYGRYLEWVFTEVVRTAPGAVRVQVHATRALRLDETADGLQTLVLDGGRELTGLSAVVLAQGHLPTRPDRDEERLAGHAALHGLRHFPPANPADLDLSAVAPGEPVLLRGLGLNFFDHMALLSTGRGGRYVREPDGTLRYEPSGHEPRLYAGSRRGVPYQARGDNAKGPYGRHQPAVLTDDVIARFRKRAESGDAPDFLDDIWPLVAKEVETVYYAALLAARGDTRESVEAFRERFLAIAHQSPQESLLLDESGVPDTDRWSWDRLSRPHPARPFASPHEHRAWLLAHLREDAAQAALGNVAGPLKAALDVLRDLRNELRRVVDHRGLSGASRRAHLDRWYTPLNAFLSIGPPRRRVEEMTALIEAGVLDVLGPRLSVRPDGAAFLAHSPDVPGSDVRVTTLIEARLPEPDVRRTADDLLATLLGAGRCRPHVVDGHETGGLDVTPRPYRLIDRQGRAHARRFAFGVPTEGVHWVTAAGARPGVDSVTLSDADAIARAALRTASGRAGAPPEGEAASPSDRMLNLQALIRFP